MENKPDLHLEKELKEQGFKYIIGVDECGRGSLSNSVVTAAVHIPEGFDTEGIKDSKKLTVKKRKELYERITASCSYVITAASEKIIDNVNIKNATMMAMKKAVEDMECADFALIDGVNVPDKLDIHSKSVIKGDNISVSIAAASIVAKVFRDSVMEILHDRYPMYGWNDNKGYGTKKHIEAIKEYGPCEYHRKTFKRVKEYC